MISLKETATDIFIRGDEKDIDQLVFDFRFRPANYYYAVSFQRWKITDGQEGWDGFIYPCRKLGRTAARLPRGRKTDLFRYAEESGIKLDTAGLLENPFVRLEIDDVRPDLISGPHQLDDRQRQCILRWLRAGIGICKAVTGAGKTEMFAGAAALIKEEIPEARLLYVTPSERLVRQTATRMREMLPHFEVGQFGGGKHESAAKDLVVCTLSMLHRRYHELRQNGFFSSFIAVLFDESHHAAAKSAQQVLEEIPAYFRLGASDSSKEKDPAKYYAIRGSFGPKLMEIKAEPLIDVGRLALPHIYVVDIKDWRGKFRGIEYRPVVGSKAYVLMDGRWHKGIYKGPVYEIDEKTGKIVTKPFKTADQDEQGNFIVEMRPVRVNGVHTVELDGTDYEIDSRWCLLDRIYDRAVIQFKSRNELVVDWTKCFHEKGWPTVVVATRTTHVYILEALLKKQIDPKLVRILIGYADDSPAERDAMFEWFKKTPGAVLISPLIKEGVSINQIAAMVVADAVADHEVMRQIVGRAMRPKKDNRAHVVTFWERQHAVLSNSSGKMLRYLEKTEGYRYYHPCAGPNTVTLSLF